MHTKEHVQKVIDFLAQATQHMQLPASLQIVNKFGQDPYLVLISCLLSLRTKDTVTYPASVRLFQVAQTPEQILKTPIPVIETLIYPVGFYRKKAILLHTISQEILDRFDGQVPSSEQDLLSLSGVGRKTMNLVRAEGFNIPALCVDVHVHRVSNRLGLINTQTPEETEHALAAIIPKENWILYTRLVLMWGQNTCVPVSPFCSRCILNPLCAKKGVTRSR